MELILITLLFTHPKFSRKPWEFDIGCMYINILKFLRLAKLGTE